MVEDSILLVDNSQPVESSYSTNPPVASGSTSSSRPTPTDTVQFPIKLINWSLDPQNQTIITTPILLQEINGPCPLIALCNTLLLNNDIRTNSFISDEGEDEDKGVDQLKFEALNNFKTNIINKYHSLGKIDLQQVLEYIGDLLLIHTENKTDWNRNHQNYNNSSQKEFTIDELLLKLPLLHTGLNVNPILISGDFEYDLATQLFELFELKFKHEYGKLVNLFDQLENFDKIQDYLLLDQQQDKEVLGNKLLIEKWLNLNQTQLTLQGLNKLNDELDINQFIIFFRNNHFNTLFKKSNQEFYILLTDSSFVNSNKSSKIIWQSLNSVSGKDDLFFMGDFTPVLDIDQDLPNVNTSKLGGDIYSQDQNPDYLLLKQLQEEEDQKYAERLQNNYNNKSRQSKSKSKSSSTTKSSLH
ncbi:hypothetical protein FOB64_005426 [Candida albicans]|uniref:MINDY deubiquitinase domain-containing protein n=1 Tax=Candida albicans TaxID=5476 RepID=A0A8H6F1F8_CANAX|nr:hypothetical protein FOB64_005426 [Candida albicans]